MTEKHGSIGTGTGIQSLVVTLILCAVGYYFILPPLNLHSLELFRFVLAAILLYFLISLLFALKKGVYQREKIKGAGLFILYFHYAKNHCKVAIKLLSAVVVVFLLGQLLHLLGKVTTAHRQERMIVAGAKDREGDQPPQQKNHHHST